MSESFSNPDPASRVSFSRRGPSGSDASALAGPDGSAPEAPTQFPQLEPTIAEDKGPSPPGGVGSPAATPPAGDPPKTFGRYALLKELARGGMGIVYMARDTVLDRVVALKTVQAAVADLTPELQERFYREARAVARLSHPHIVPIYDIGRHDGQDFFAMAFMPGGRLDRHAQRFSEPAAAAGLLEKIARAVHGVHEHGILHRDLKPANILLDEHGEPRVSDFGLAKFRDAEVDITNPGAVLGTPSYMAPEQARGQTDRIGPATDVWALGVILYELVSGRKPFQATRREVVASLICTEDPPRPASLRQGLDSDLERIILRCLEKEPERRYTALALADDLHRWLAGQAIASQTRSLIAPCKRFVGRHPVAVSTALVSVLLLLLLAAGLAVVNRPASKTSTAEGLRQTAPDEPNAERRDEVAGVGPIRLIPNDGRPKWYHTVNSTQVIPRVDRIGELELRNFRPAVVELLSKPPPWDGGYRLTADVNVYDGKPGGNGGICVGSIEWKPGVNGQPERWWISVESPFEAAPGAGKANSGPVVRILLHRNREGIGKDGFENSTILGSRPLKIERPDKQSRRLQIDVNRQAIAAYVDDELIVTVPHEVLVGGIRSLAVYQPQCREPPTPEHFFEGALGLFNENASTEFRNVVVEPLR
jgi:hypothetical protein